jgi:hypothetical protein
MNAQIRMWFVIACAALATIACEVILSATPTPIIVVVTATPAPSLVVIVVTATPAPTTAPVASPTSQPVAVAPTIAPTRAPTQIAPTLTPIPVGASPTPFLPQLGVFDQGGGDLELTVFGTALAQKQLGFRAVACAPDCFNRPDGANIELVQFIFARRTPGGTLQHLYDYTDYTAPYCAFGGEGRCEFLDVSNPNATWLRTQTVIANGEYVLQIFASGRRSGRWSGFVQFRVQR